ncbi:SbcC/MukB-like Walker B domain-containing protein [Paenibacillus pini]|nr:SbcC/MukB-like Walker B domain-containing protein [Paenibacillus pini]
MDLKWMISLEQWSSLRVKFAEFLSLKGSERRQMLQRLFHLEQYGDQLAAKLSRRVKENDAVLQTVEAEQQGLGNAGAEALKEAKHQLKNATGHADSSRKQLHEMNTRVEQRGKVRDWQLQRNTYQSQLDQLSAKSEQISVLEQKLSYSSSAQLIRPALIQWLESKKEWDQRQVVAISSQSEAEAAEQIAKQASAEDEAMQHKLSVEEPQLRQRQDQLEQAVDMQQESQKLQVMLNDLTQKKQETMSELDQQRQLLIKEQELLAKGQKRQSVLQESLNQLEVRSKERDTVNIAMRRLQRLRSCDDQLLQVQKELQQQEDKCVAARQKIEQSVGEQEAWQKKYEVILRERASYIEALSSWENRTILSLHQLDKEEELLRQALKQAQVHALSLALASELQSGAPCSVCGSTHHPSPAVMEEHTNRPAETLEAQLESLRDTRNRLQELRLTLRQLLHESRSLALTEHVETDAASDEVAASIEVVPSNASEDELKENTVDGLNELIEIESTVLELSRTLERIRNEISGFKAQQEDLRRSSERYVLEAEAGEHLLEQLRIKAVRLEEESLGLRQEWKQELPELEPQEAEFRLTEIQRKDAESEQVKERLQISVPFLEEKRQSVQSLEQRMIELDKALIQWDTQLQGKQELLIEKKKRLQVWVGEERAEELLEACKQQLLVLREKVAGSKQRRHEAELAGHEKAKAAAMAAQAAASACEHHQNAAARWEEQLASSPFETAEEVETSSLKPEQEAQHTEQVKQHRESEREAMIQLRKLDQQLAGDSVTEEEWQGLTAQLEQCRTADEEALQVRARAQRDLEDVEKRHIRWTELEQIRVQRHHEGEKLSKLQSCLRGNAFVEYIAEEQLMQVSQSASQRLRFLTKQRYALEVDSGGGFLIRDDANGGVRRPVSTLSGGETFLTSLSLALALSAQIQLRGQYPLQFFFLDEGFGTLDPELLDTVITSLERLHNDQLTVGIISHVPELRARLPRKLVVLPAEQAGAGSRIVVEQM